MAVENSSLTQRKKKLFKSKFQRSNNEKLKAEGSEVGTANTKLNFVYFAYIIAFLAVISSLSWLILCKALCNELEICNSEFLTSFGERKENLNIVKENLKPQPRVPKDDASLWVLDRRSNLSLSEFIEKYDGKRPVIITDVLKDWKASKWNKEFFVENYGDRQVVMKAVHGKLHQAESIALPMRIFAQHSHEGRSKTWTYLQDELFIQLHPELRKDLGNPIYLREDFFKIFPKEVRPWNAMLLWGTAYSRSYLHVDPYNWTGTNAVFYGKKLWKLYPPGQDEYLYVMPNKMSEFPLNCFKYNSPIDAYDPDVKKYPKFLKAREISFEQKPGELLIIPPGWFHQAFNAVETIAVSSQVMNSQNYDVVLEEIFKAGNVDRKTLPEDFYQLPPIEQIENAV
ncbi:F-box protein At1g78280-like isoform X2 [Dendronephthya gigantea]|uniref:F-box protein At1g78280-like isoform X2 n=1 Tax=Dendronephthya gigantea TaxID=151771 RepID=UPI00106C1FFE|nr:F-box protein At1g78280-like isoform X2 [Dendronephthya gigantea]